MEKRVLGGDGLISSSIGLACRSPAGHRRAETLRFLGQALDTGVTLFDVSNTEVQELAGTALGARRDAVSVAVGLPAAGLPHGCEAALDRLATDRIDLLYVDHTGSSVPVEESAALLAGLRKAGKAGSIGFHGVTAGELRRAHAVEPVDVLVAEYSLCGRSAERELIPAARELGAGLLARSPLAGGLLAGRTLPDELRALQEIAAEHHLGLPRIALAWLLAQGDDIVPVVGTADQLHLEMDVSADGVRLEAELRELLAAVCPP